MYKRILMVAVLMLPTIAFAQDAGAVKGGLQGTLEQVDAVLKFALGIAMPLAIAAFFWGLIKYIHNAENADLKKKGSVMMLNAGIALFLMVGIWSVISYAKSSITGGQDMDDLVEVKAPPIGDVTGLDL